MTFQNVDIQIQLFESLPAELSLKNDGERNVELLPLETQVTSMQQIWKKYELFLNKKKNRTKSRALKIYFEFLLLSNVRTFLSQKIKKKPTNNFFGILSRIITFKDIFFYFRFLPVILMFFNQETDNCR